MSENRIYNGKCLDPKSSKDIKVQKNSTNPPSSSGPQANGSPRVQTENDYYSNVTKGGAYKGAK